MCHRMEWVKIGRGCQVNTAGGVELPIEAFPGRFSLVLQHGANCCYVTKSLCRVSTRIAAVFLRDRLKRIN